VRLAIKHILIGTQLLRPVKSASNQDPFGMKPLRHASLVQLHFPSGMKQRKHVKYVQLQPQHGTMKLKSVNPVLKVSLCGMQARNLVNNAKFPLLFGTRL
jgi:hypothetical protein